MLDDDVQNKSIREELIKITATFSRKITSYALLEDITELQGMGFSPKELMVNTDQQLLKNCLWVLTKSEDFRTDLVDYGIDSLLLEKFRNQIDQFKTSLRNIEISSDMTSITFEESSNLFKEKDKIFEGKPKGMMLEHNHKH